MRRITKVLLLCTVLALLISGCGASSGAKDIDPASLAADILDKVDFKQSLTLAEGAALDNLYLLDDKVVSHAIYYDAGTFSAEEIAVLKAASEGDAKHLEDILNTRLDALVFTFENYNPGEMAKINSPVLVRNGSVVVMVLSDDAKALDKVNKLLE